MTSTSTPAMPGARTHGNTEPGTGLGVGVLGPGVLGAICFGLLIASLIVLAALSGGDTIPTPFSDTADVAAFFADHGSAARTAAMLQLASSIVLGLYALTAGARLRRLGVRGAGPGIGVFGGTAATILLAVSACVTWTQGQDVVSAQAGLTHALAFIGFVTGGAAHVVGLGVLVAGIAVSSRTIRLLPAPVSVGGLVIAVLAGLSALSMVAEPMQVLIPIGRFGSLIWLVIAGFLLSGARSSRKAGA